MNQRVDPKARTSPTLSLCDFMKKYIAIIFTLLFVRPAFAELSLCNGQWTNKPCEQGSKEKSIQQAPPRKKKSAEQSKKETLVHQFRMRTIELKRQGHDIPYTPQTSIDRCMLEGTEFAECDSLMKEAHMRLDDQVRASKLNGEKKTEEGAQKPTVNTTVVNINNNRSRRCLPGELCSGIVSRRKTQKITSGSSIRIQGKSASGANVSVGGSANVTTEERQIREVLSE